MQEVMKAMTQEAERARTVLIMTRCCWLPLARAPLKEGQNIQRKMQPTMAKRSEFLEGRLQAFFSSRALATPSGEACLFKRERPQEAPRPK